MGKNSVAKKIRMMLLANGHGMTTSGIASMIDSTPASVLKALKGMPDSYIYEWVMNMDNHQYMSVWRVVEVPENAARPDDGFPRFKAINENWMNDLRKLPRRTEPKIKEPKPKKIKVPAVRKDEPPKYQPQKTVWQPVAPWPKVERQRA